MKNILSVIVALLVSSLQAAQGVVMNVGSLRAPLSPSMTGASAVTATLVPALPQPAVLSVPQPLMMNPRAGETPYMTPPISPGSGERYVDEPTPAYQPERRRISESFQFDGNEAVKVAFFDADSTLRVSPAGGVSAKDPKDVMLLPWVGPKLAELVRQGYLIAIVSNQAGIPKHISLENSDRALAYTVELIREQGGDVHYFDLAEYRDHDRKPQVGMALRLEKALQDKFGPNVRIDKANSIMVGDSAYKKANKKGPGDIRPDGAPGTHFANSDRLFAENYGIAFVEPTDFFGWRRFGIDVFTRAKQVREFLKAHPNP
jgi:DNA 3'-phosphatase